MKTFIVSVVCLIVGVSAFADVVQVAEDGKVRVIPREENWRSLTPIEAQAHSNPGTEIRIWETKVEKIGFFHFVAVSNNIQAVMFDGKNIKYVDTEEVVGQGEPRFLYHKLFIFLALGFVVASNVAYMGYFLPHSDAAYGCAAIAAILAACAFVAVIAVAYIFAASIISTAYAAVSAAVAACGAEDSHDELHGVFSIVFYISCLVALFV